MTEITTTSTSMIKQAYTELSDLSGDIMVVMETRDVGELVMNLGKLEGSLIINIMIVTAMLVMVYSYSRPQPRTRAMVVKTHNRSLVIRIGSAFVASLVKIFLCMFLFVVLSIKFHELTWTAFGKRHETGYDRSVENHVVKPMVAAGFKEEDAYKMLDSLGVGSLTDVKQLMKKMVLIVTKRTNGTMNITQGVADLSAFWGEKFAIIYKATMNNKPVVASTIYSVLATAYPLTSMLIGSVTGKGSQIATLNVDIAVMNTSVKLFVTSILTQKIMDLSIMLLVSLGLAALTAQTAVFPKYSIIKKLVKSLTMPIHGMIGTRKDKTTTHDYVEARYHALESTTR